MLETEVQGLNLDEKRQKKVTGIHALVYVTSLEYILIYNPIPGLDTPKKRNIRQLT